MLLSVVAVWKDAIIQMDVKNAFLYGEIDSKIYMKQPEGNHDGTYRVCKLVKALYGINWSPRMWYHKFLEIMEKHQFRKNIHDEALFISDKSLGNPIWCLIYVDDILMTSPSTEVLRETIEGQRKKSTLTTLQTLS